MASIISPVLKTSITKSDVSTSSKLRFYVKRELNVKKNSDLARTCLHHKFQSLCDRELEYQELTSDISISCFCRTGVIGTSVILETDSDADTARVHLQRLTFTPMAAKSAAKYIITLHRKACVCRPANAKICEKFSNTRNKETIVKWVFDESLRRVQSFISPATKRFSDEDIIQKIGYLRQRFLSLEACVVHSNYNADNIVVKPRTGNFCKVVSFGGELSHTGHPAYDVATFLADLYVWYHIHDSSCEMAAQDFCITLKACIGEYLNTYFDEFDLSVRDDKVVGDMMFLVAGYAGICMIFRLMGNDWNERIAIESCVVKTNILECAYELIKGYGIINSVDDLLSVGLGIK